jgi:hypothetical protein
MKTIDWTKWSAIAEVFSALAIIVTLVYLSVQTRYLAEQTQQNNRFIEQGQDIALADGNLARLSTRIGTLTLLNQHPGIWSRGSMGEELDAAELVVFQNQVVALNDGAFYDYLRLRALTDEESAIGRLLDFAAVLYRNPGARSVWEKREDDLVESRAILNPEADGGAIWRNPVLDALARLDSAQM